MLAVMLMEGDRMVQKHAAAAGLGDVAVSYRNISGPVAMRDGVLSGGHDIGINGAPSVLLLWDKTRNSGNGWPACAPRSQPRAPAGRP